MERSDDLLKLAGNILPASLTIRRETTNTAPQAKGAYALVIAMNISVEFSYRGHPHCFSPGLYVYAGSAWGPGGIRARLHRHFRREKALHWHVDHLTTAAHDIHALSIEGGTECNIIARLGGRPGFQYPLAGFGSSDCRICPSHLLSYRPSPG